MLLLPLHLNNHDHVLPSFAEFKSPQVSGLVLHVIRGLRDAIDAKEAVEVASKLRSEQLEDKLSWCLNEIKVLCLSARLCFRVLPLFH